MFNKNTFLKRFEEIKNYNLFEKSLNPILSNKSVEDRLTKYKISMYTLLFILVTIGIILIIVGAFLQKHKNVLVPLLVVGLFFVFVLSLIDIFIWISIILNYLRKIILQHFNQIKIMNLYINFLSYFDCWKIFSADCFIDYDGFLNLGGAINEYKFKVTIKDQTVCFYLNQKLILKNNVHLHNWNLKLDLSTSAIDKMKRKPKEAIEQLIKLQLYKNIEMIAEDLYEAYYEKPY